MCDDDRRIHLPLFPPEYRASGLLLHVTSLPSPYGVGDVGPAALAWGDRLRAAGQSWWQALPLGPTGYGDSPYQPLSSFAGNGLLISPDWLIEDGLLRASDVAGHSFSETAVAYDAVVPFKHRLLETAWTNFTGGARPDLAPVFEQFCDDHAHWLVDPAGVVRRGCAGHRSAAGCAQPRPGGSDECAGSCGRQLALAYARTPVVVSGLSSAAGTHIQITASAPRWRGNREGGHRDCVITPNPLVFLVGVGNTLLDNTLTLFGIRGD
jgi:hypothetical protein